MSILNILKPWAGLLCLGLILRFTGALSGLSFITQSAMMETGLMDFTPSENETAAESFDYDFTIKDLKGNTVDVDQYKGKVIFLNLWATWCGPCRVEMPSIQNLYNTIDHDKVVFIMLSLDTPGNEHKIEKYINDKKFTFPVFVPKGSLPQQLNVPSIPTTFIIGKDGTIKTKKVGASNYDTNKFRKYLTQMTSDKWTNDK